MVDNKKDKINIKKHGISFEEAITIFEDPLLKLAFDKIIDGEERYNAIGFSRLQNTLIVIH